MEKKGNAGLCWGQCHDILPWRSAHYANNSLTSHQPSLRRAKEMLGWQLSIKCARATQMPNQEVNSGSQTTTTTTTQKQNTFWPEWCKTTQGISCSFYDKTLDTKLTFLQASSYRVLRLYFQYGYVFSARWFSFKERHYIWNITLSA